jgi:hypothetical protein
MRRILTATVATKAGLDRTQPDSSSRRSRICSLCNRPTILPRSNRSANDGLLASAKCCSQRHDDLAEMLVGVHVLERAADVVEGKDAVDRQLQLALLEPCTCPLVMPRSARLRPQARKRRYATEPDQNSGEKSKTKPLPNCPFARNRLFI